MIPRSFDDTLAISDRHDEAWEAFYRHIWPEAERVCSVFADREGQRAGMADRLIYLPNGRVWQVEEKLRFKAYGDLLVEVWSQWYGADDPRNRVGWTLDHSKRADWIAYAVVPQGLCWLIPADLLRRAASRMAASWVRVYGWVDVKNRDYVTRNVAVPMPVVFEALTAEIGSWRW